MAVRRETTLFRGRVAERRRVRRRFWRGLENKTRKEERDAQCECGLFESQPKPRR